MLSRIPVIDAIDLGGLAEHVRTDLHGAQRRCGVRRKIRIARSCGEDHGMPKPEVPHCAPSYVRLGDLLDLDGRHDSSRHPVALQGVLHRQRVDDRRKHPHVVALGAIHATASALEATENIASADDDSNLEARRMHPRELLSRRLEGVGIDSESAFAPTEGLSAEFYERTTVD